MEDVIQARFQAALLAVLCSLDAFFTLFYIQTGFAVEANPIMAFYYEISPVSFLGAKVLLTLGGLYILVRYLNRRVTRFTLSVLSLIYLFTVIYHLHGVFYLIG